jgi:hypothetical protein
VIKKIKGRVNDADLEPTDRKNKTHDRSIHLRSFSPFKKKNKEENPKKKQRRVLI